MKICIVGGGGSVAVATRFITERMQDASIEVFTKRDVAGYRPCELTYVLGKQIKDFETIISFDSRAMEAKKIKYHFSTGVTEINRREKYIVADDGKYSYDKLILASGSAPILPAVQGGNGKGVYVLGTDVQYARQLEAVIARSKSALIIGAGAIGLETAEVLAQQGYERVVVADVADRPLAKALDKEMADMVAEKLQSIGVELLFGTQVAKIEDSGEKKLVTLTDRSIEVDFVLAAVGFRPNSELARNCGLEIGLTGGIRVDNHMLTSDPDIYAIGDVSEGWDVIDGKPLLAMKADNAVRTGRVAGRHLTGDGEAEYCGTVGAFIIYLAETFVGGIGYTEEAARTLPGRDIKTVWHEGMTLPKYLGGQPVKLKLIYDAGQDLLLGVQMLSRVNISSELDRLALAISEKINVRKLAGTEIVYTPASGWPYGPVAQALDKCY